MFIRIKKRLIKSGISRATDYSYRFVIVESYRKDGVPRQRIVKYLGSIRASKLKGATDRHNFLQEMQKRLNQSGFTPLENSSLSLSLIRCIIRRGRGGKVI